MYEFMLIYLWNLLYTKGRKYKIRTMYVEDDGYVWELLNLFNDIYERITKYL